MAGMCNGILTQHHVEPVCNSVICMVRVMVLVDCVALSQAISCASHPFNCVMGYIIGMVCGACAVCPPGLSLLDYNEIVA